MLRREAKGRDRSPQRSGDERPRVREKVGPVAVIVGTESVIEKVSGGLICPRPAELPPPDRSESGPCQRCVHYHFCPAPLVHRAFSVYLRRVAG
jgi:hypothetical protein